MNEGFYKNDNGSLLYAPNFVSGPGFELKAGDHEKNTLLIEGWWWFDTLQDACNNLGLNVKDYE